MNNQTKKLYKSHTDTMISGVLGGIAEYYDVDSTLVRVGFITVLLMTGLFPGILAYVIAFFMFPDAPVHASDSQLPLLKQDTHPVVTHTETKPIEKTDTKVEEKVENNPENKTEEKPEEKTGTTA